MNSVEMCRELELRYKDYLKSTFYFSDPVLRTSFENALDSPYLAKGPYLQKTPVFKTGLSLADLYKRLSGKPLDCEVAEALNADRPLYLHQQKAIEKVLSGKNVVVSTGTGSGKTESFLLPIILSLYEQHKSGSLGAGVRALILYPMNALANDQRDRLAAVPENAEEAGGILHELEKRNSDFNLTLGQYIGDTPENENDSFRTGKSTASKSPRGEMVTREEMRDTAPNILITNFSMLEYLLLRPSDSPLFDGNNSKTWTFLVLDEAHQYKGTKGMEMAMLIRRLKERLISEGCQNSFRCIATSASLANRDEGRKGIAEFASALFGEPFEEEDVLLGETERTEVLASTNLNVGHYEQLAAYIAKGDDESVRKVVFDLSKHCAEIISTRGAIGALLLQDFRTKKFFELLAEPRLVRTLSQELFPELVAENREAAFETFLQLLLEARSPQSGRPLLGARFHLFLRSLEGAFILLGKESEFSLERSNDEGKANAHELALCRECGQHYLVGLRQGDFLREAIRDPSNEHFGADFFRILDFDPQQIADDRTFSKLCKNCSRICAFDQKLSCGHEDFVFLEQAESSKEREDTIPKCVVCEYKGQDPVREIVHGTDGPHAVIATTLFKNLPDHRKKILAFSDGRQAAAFFAWYLDSSYRQITERSCVLQAVSSLQKEYHSAPTLEGLVDRLKPLLQESLRSKLVGQESLDTLSWRSIFRELLTDEQRISLEGVGLVRWRLNLLDDVQIPNKLYSPPWNLTKAQATELVEHLIDSLRTDRAVMINPSLPWRELDIQATNASIVIGAAQASSGTKSWDGSKNRRVALLKRLLPEHEENKDVKSVEILRELFDTIRNADRNHGLSDKMLIPVGDAFKLNWRRYLAESPQDSEISVCEVCSRVSPFVHLSICPRHRCPGKLKRLDSEKLRSDHYRKLYGESRPKSLRVEEHTAQLSRDSARLYQREFKEGKIDILSCSTTFELGVDLGDLDTVFLRNVPPEAFNYDQRVGRSGRRAGQPGLAITFCKRSPHDLYHFLDPLRSIVGSVTPPVMTLTNHKIILRHLTAVALSEFFRKYPSRFASIDAFISNWIDPAGASDLQAFLQENKLSFKEKLERTLNLESLSEQQRKKLNFELGLQDGRWLDLICGTDSRLGLSESEVASDFRAMSDFEKNASSERDYDTAKWASARADTIRNEKVLNFLSRKAVIPKYGFPVDVVELDTNKIAKGNAEQFTVELTRDLSIAISEFAPSSALVANKLLWTSHAVKKVDKKEWPIKNYLRCGDHNLFLSWDTAEQAPESRCFTCQRAVEGAYLVPQFGFVTKKGPPVAPKQRISKLFSTRPYLARSSTDAEVVDIPSHNPVVRITKTRPEKMVVVCEGKRSQGFLVCRTCGYGLANTGRPATGRPKRTKKDEHQTYWGAKCSGEFISVSLGHDFTTDILQIDFQLQPAENQYSRLALGYSLASALVEGAAEHLQVPSSDINATVGEIKDGCIVPALILYDNVPGGAGLVSRLEDSSEFKKILVAAKNRVSGKCGCSGDTSCYACLRSYRNQFVHDKLSRTLAGEYLEQVLTSLGGGRSAVLASY